MSDSAHSSPTRRSSGFQVLLAVAAGILAIAFTIPLANRLDPIAGDIMLMQHQKAYSGPTQDIVLVAITEETLATLPYRSPIDRQFLAELLGFIDSGSPRVIGLDILIDGPSEPDKDQRLITTLDAIVAPVVFASASIENGLTDRQSAYLAGLLENRLSGSIVLQRDRIDGVLRHLPVLQDENGNRVRTFASVLAKPDSFHLNEPGRVLYMPEKSADSGAFARYPAHTVTLLPPEWFEDKTVLIGTDLPKSDRHMTPMSNLGSTGDPSLPGIEVHANIANQILSQLSLSSPDYMQTLAMITLGALLAIFGFHLVSRPGLYFAALFVAVVLYGLLCYGLLNREIALLPLTGPVTAAVLASFLLSLTRWWQDRAERVFLETAFSKYVGAPVVQKLTSGNIELALGGEKRQVTYLFTDLEGFTSLAQSLPPDQIGSLLNEYLDKVCDLVTAHGATIDKIIGDAVVCFFGAPDEDRHQAENGVRLAMGLDELCQAFRAQANDGGIPLGTTRIGLHTGEAIVGNFGGKRFFDYTGIGDTVNIAARLESVNRHLGTRICVSASVAENCKGVMFRPLGNLILKGRSTGILCFEPCSPETMSLPWMRKYLDGYDQLKSGQARALKTFNETAKLNPGDGPTQFHLDRLKQGIVDVQVRMWEK